MIILQDERFYLQSHNWRCAEKLAVKQKGETRQSFKWEYCTFSDNLSWKASVVMHKLKVTGVVYRINEKSMRDKLKPCRLFSSLHTWATAAWRERGCWIRLLKSCCWSRQPQLSHQKKKKKVLGHGGCWSCLTIHQACRLKHTSG